MTHETVFHRIARADLFDIYDYIARQSGRARAGDYLGRIEEACNAPRTFPRRERHAMTLRLACEPGRLSVGY
nr:type II toxin-antitoxin system RelE/ParE family toxin [Methylobacterium platani]